MPVSGARAIDDLEESVGGLLGPRLRRMSKLAGMGIDRAAETSSGASELKRLRLRYAGTCVWCGAPMAIGAEALHDRRLKTVHCVTCPVDRVDGRTSHRCRRRWSIGEARIRKAGGEPGDESQGPLRSSTWWRDPRAERRAAINSRVGPRLPGRTGACRSSYGARRRSSPQRSPSPGHSRKHRSHRRRRGRRIRGRCQALRGDHSDSGCRRILQA